MPAIRTTGTYYFRPVYSRVIVIPAGDVGKWVNDIANVNCIVGIPIL